MYIKKTTKRVKGKEYHNYLLVEAVSTPKGPRQRVVCSLGNLAPKPANEWLAWARRVEARLAGQLSLEPDPDVEAVVQRTTSKTPRRREARKTGLRAGEVIKVVADEVTVEEPREVGPVHVGHQILRRLGLDEVLAEVGLDERARRLTEAMTLNRLIAPASEHAMPHWMGRTALPDILGAELASVYDERLQCNLDRLHPRRVAIERALAERERRLFGLQETVYLYDLTSTYFEGQCLANGQAQRGYSPDKRPDAKQVLVGLVIDGDGFPKAHEVFEGNRPDHTTVAEMLAGLEERVGMRPGATVVVDRGMAYGRTLAHIRSRGYHYLVAARQAERERHWADFEDQEGWEEVRPEGRAPAGDGKAPGLRLKRRQVGNEVHVLCQSPERAERDLAIQRQAAQRLEADLRKLQERIRQGRLVREEKIQQAIGRLAERHPRVARCYDISYDSSRRSLLWSVNPRRQAKAEELAGSYLLRTSRQDLSAEEIWRTYMLLTRVESAFRTMKTPLAERPIWHKTEHRVQAHIFLCVLAYHLLVAIDKRFHDRGLHTSWATLREQLATHQVVTVVLPTSSGRTLRIRRDTTPEPIHEQIYETLGIPSRPMTPVRRWT